MASVTYHVVAHDEGYAYKVGDVFSEPFPTHDDALQAARAAAAEHRVSGESAEISFEDASGHWHTEHADGSDRPETNVSDDV